MQIAVVNRIAQDLLRGRIHVPENHKARRLKGDSRRPRPIAEPSRFKSTMPKCRSMRSSFSGLRDTDTDRDGQWMRGATLRSGAPQTPGVGASGSSVRVDPSKLGPPRHADDG